MQGKGQEPKESTRAHAAFLEYCDLGPGRSLRKLAEKYVKSTSKVRQFQLWSSQHNWQDRVKLYDAERIAEKRRKQDEAIEAMNERHATLGMQQQERAVEQITTLISAKSFGSVATVQLLKLATDLERQARGASTEPSEQGSDNASAVQVIFYFPKVEHEEGYHG